MEKFNITLVRSKIITFAQSWEYKSNLNQSYGKVIIKTYRHEKRESSWEFINKE